MNDVRGDGKEKVKVNLIDEKKVKTIMKRFCGSKATDPEITRWYMVKDGLHYMATTLGSSVEIYFKNKFAGTYNPLGKTYFTKPTKDAEIVDAIEQYVEVKDGKKKKLMKTGHKLEFPDVHGIFDKLNLEEFNKVVFSSEEFDEMIQIHETMLSMEKLSGRSFTTVLRIKNNKLMFTVYDSPFKFMYEKIKETKAEVNTYFYNPTYMINIFKSLKDLGVEQVEMLIHPDQPILFQSSNLEYIFKFAMNRKVVAKNVQK